MSTRSEAEIRTQVQRLRAQQSQLTNKTALVVCSAQIDALLWALGEEAK